MTDSTTHNRNEASTLDPLSVYGRNASRSNENGACHGGAEFCSPGQAAGPPTAGVAGNPKSPLISALFRLEVGDCTGARRELLLALANGDLELRNSQPGSPPLADPGAGGSPTSPESVLRSSTGSASGKASPPRVFEPGGSCTAALAPQHHAVNHAGPPAKQHGRPSSAEPLPKATHRQATGPSSQKRAESRKPTGNATGKPSTKPGPRVHELSGSGTSSASWASAGR